MAEEVSKGQELVDASRIIQSGIRTDDSETRSVGWKRLRKLFGGGKSKQIYNSLVTNRSASDNSTNKK